MTYNGLNQSQSGFTATGLVNGETTSVLTGVTATGSGTNAGHYNVVATGTDSNYNLSFTPGILAIAKADLTLSGTEIYNGTTTLAGSHLTASGVHGETFTVTGSGATALSTANVQTGQALANVSNLGLGTSSNGGLSTNYKALTQQAV